MRHAEISQAYGIHPILAVDVANQAARLALTALPNNIEGKAATPLARGHVIRQVDDNSVWLLRALPASDAGNWSEWILDPASKAYVDAMAQGLQVKQSVRSISTTNITLSGAQTVNGVALVAGDRCLVAGQSSAAQNGPYVVANGAWQRAPDANTSAEVMSGMFVRITEGTRAGEGWVLTTTGDIVLGTTPLTFSVFDGVGIAQQVTANTSAIALKADQSTVAALTTTVSSKADQSGLASLTTTVGTKADTSALNALTATVNTKADASALTTLQGTVTANTSAIATKADAATTTTALAAKADRYQAPINYAGTALTLDATHVEGYIRTTSLLANTMTIPLNFAAMPIGSYISGIQAAAGRTQFVKGDASIVIKCSAQLYTLKEGSPWTLYKAAANEYDLSGELLA